MSKYCSKTRKIPRNFTYLQIFDLRLQTFADIGKNQYIQAYKYVNIGSYLHLYVGCELLSGCAHACRTCRELFVALFCFICAVVNCNIFIHLSDNFKLVKAFKAVVNAKK